MVIQYNYVCHTIRSKYALDLIILHSKQDNNKTVIRVKKKKNALRKIINIFFLEKRKIFFWIPQ